MINRRKINPNDIIIKPSFTIDPNEYLLHFENILYNQPRLKFDLSNSWLENFPDNPGVYVIFENNELCYVGETGNLKERMKDIRRTVNHSFRRTTGKRLYADLPGFKPASSTCKFSPDIEKKLDQWMIKNLSFSSIPLFLGRKELEERICAKEGILLKFNNRSRRKSNSLYFNMKEEITPITESELQKLDGFIGYGRKDAEVIFLGLEEAGGSIKNIKKRLEIPEYEYLDCKRIHIDHFGVNIFHSDIPEVKVAFQPVWRFMSYIMLRWENKSTEKITDKLLRDYQNNHLGTIKENGKTLLTEIYPLPCNSLSDWKYTDLIPDYKNKNKYKRKVLNKRICTFNSLINSSEFNAKAIICYGKSHWSEFIQFFSEFDINFQDINLSKPCKIGKFRSTNVLLVPFLGNGRVSYEFLDELVDLIKSPNTDVY